MSRYQVLSRSTGRREVRRVDLPIVGWDKTRGNTVGSTVDGACFSIVGGRLFSWFREDSAAYQENDAFVLGDTRTTDLFTPGEISALPRVERLAIGAYHGLAITSNGTLWSWGDNFSGQLGYDPDPAYNPWGEELYSSPARQVPNVDGVNFVSAEWLNSVWTTKAGYAYAVGARDAGWLVTTEPERLQLPNRVLEIACGIGTWAYIDEDGNLYSFDWYPSWYTGESNVLNHTTVWSGGGFEQIRTSGDSEENPFYARHKDGRLFMGGVFLDGVAALDISNGGYFVGDDGNLSSLMDVHSALGAGPFTETGGIVSRNADEIYTFDPDWNNKTRVI